MISFFDRPVQNSGQCTENYACNPDAIVIPHTLVQVPTQPDATKCPKLMTQKHDAVQESHVSGSEEYRDQA